MRILKHGDHRKTDRMKKFICPECGCEFIAGPTEMYKHINNQRYSAYCPDCYTLCNGNGDAAKLKEE